MSQGAAALWERVLERDPGLKEALSSTRVVESGDDSVDADPFVDLDTKFDDEEAEPADPFADFGTKFDDDEAKQTELDDFDPTIRIDDDGAEPNQAENVVDVTFEESADLWLSRSHLALEHALRLMRLKGDVFPTKPPATDLLLPPFKARRTRVSPRRSHAGWLAPPPTIHRTPDKHCCCKNSGIFPFDFTVF